MLITIIEVGLLRTNCYLITNEKNETCIIDPGDDFSVIQSTLEKLKFQPAAVLLTHGHFDHIMVADVLRKEYNIPIYAGDAEKELFENPAYNGSALTRKTITLAVDNWLSNGKQIFGMKVLHTPGHTAGSVCFYLEDEKKLLSGDTLFLESFGRTDFPTGDFLTLKKSICDLLFTLPNDVVVYPGHGEKTSIGYERQNNMILKI